MKAWYFGTENKKLRYGDNRPIKVGETHSVDPSKLELCSYGLHASKRLIDALQYAPSTILYEVELSGKVIEGEDKVVAECRTYLREIDATPILREFARKQALINIEKIKPYCKTEDYKLILHWLNTGDESVRLGARSAAYSAAWSAAAWSAAAWSAARSAAESVARSAAARSVARSAAWSAAYSAAWSAAYSAAARSAAWSAAYSAANEMLEQMVKDSSHRVKIKERT